MDDLIEQPERVLKEDAVHIVNPIILTTVMLHCKMPLFGGIQMLANTRL